MHGKATLRENKLTTMARRAGNMESADYIEIGGTVRDEDRFADFCASVVDEWDEADHDFSFDEFIETALIKKYGIQKDEEGK